MHNHDIEKELLEMTKQLLVESGETYQRDIYLDSSLQKHLGLDSVGRAELFGRIEKKFTITLPDKLLAEAETLDDIAKFIHAAHPENQPLSQKKIIATHEETSLVNPLQANTLIDLLLLYGKHSPQKVQIFFQDEDGKEVTVTYGELLKNSLRVANGLRECGLQEKEAVAIMQPTHLGFFYTFLGTLLAGGIPVPIYPPFRRYMLEAYAKMEAQILRNAEVRILVTFERAENLSRLLQGFVPSLKTVTTVNALLKADELTTVFKATADDFAFIQYTSGSTSDPKGVLLTHQNLLANIRAYGNGLQVVPQDVVVSWLPLYHDFGLIGAWLGSLYHGVPLVLMAPFSFLNHPERWLWAIHYHRGTISGAPNFAYDLCVRKIDPSKIEGLDLSSWRVAANGAEKVYPRTLQQFTDKFAPYGFKRHALLPVYGLAESTVGLTIPPLGRDFRIDYIDRKLFEEKRQAVPSTEKNALEFVSCGLALAGHELRIVDENNQALAERHIGHLQFRGPSSMQAYYNNPIATKNIYHPGNWLSSGDLAYLADKELFITGRHKDLIIKAGRNLYPVEIEELVGGIPGIRQGCVAAFGITAIERGTEQLVVVAETREKNKIKRQQLIDEINHRIASTLDMVPDQVVLAAPHAVPKTSSGKLQRSACKTKYLQGKINKTHVPAWLQIIKLGFVWLVRQAMAAAARAIKLIYTFYLAVVIGVTFLPVYLIVLFSSRALAEKTCRLWAKYILAVSLCPRKTIGRENLKTASPVIFAANHASYIDGLILLALVPPQTYFVGKRELFSVPVLRTFLRKLSCLGVDRIDFSKGMDDTQQIKKILKDGHSIIIFPEGTFGYAKGLRPFRLGAFKMAAETNVPVCPVALQGTRNILRADEKILKRGPLTITICAPIFAAGSEWQDVTQLRHLVRAEIAKYCGEASLDFIAAQTVAPKSC